jgi:hypothetical protein
MGAAWLLTVLAVAGIVTGVLMGRVSVLSSLLGAAGGGLLAGIALFWLLPEIAAGVGWTAALLMALIACVVMLLLDRFLEHSDYMPGHSVIGPLLVAAALHSFLDGWSVRAFSGQALADVAVPVGLALHKVPEGLALGWISHKSLRSASKSIAAGAAAESMTLLGGFVEPRTNQFGLLAFGAWWEAVVLAVIAGSFLFLGCHALLPDWKRPRMLLVFFATVALAGVLKR